VVFAAASLSDAFGQIAVEFEVAHPSVKVLLNLAPSSELAIQLAEGAAADVFASASQAQMQVAADPGRLAGQPVVFATNQLTILAPADNPADLHTPADLAKPGLRLVLAAPGAPVRQYSDQRIALMGDAVFQTAVYANLASEEPNVRQVATRVLLGEADAGIVYASDVTPDIAGRVLQIAIQAAQNVVATYPIVVVGEAPGGEVAQAFADFVLGPDGQSILQEWGFGN